MNRRLRASGLHLFVSACVALLAGLVVFLVWYPPPYATIAGGTALFFMLVGIDVVLGPALTALVASPSKPIAELRRDVGLIALVQLLAFGYGMYTIAIARPVHIVFEIDRFTVVTAADLDTAQLAKASTPFRELPWTGPTLIAARRSTSNAELLNSLDLGMQGVDLAMQPERWVDYGQSRAKVTAAARPMKPLTDKYPQVLFEVQGMAAKHGVSMENMRYLPLTSRSNSWVALIAIPDVRIVGYLPVDGFL